MYIKPLTKIQQGWLEHINQASEQKLSMSAYAKQNNLALKSFYNARSMLIKKDMLPVITHNPLVPVTLTPSNTKQVISSCRILLCNGVIIELADIKISELLNSANQL
ncbi:hypothetical protein JI57_02140 [Psychromonas sp. PRT-SC03]|nr:hypothetical protein JI57_02140 [Psychromonas sp. PRT-SC03]